MINKVKNALVVIHQEEKYGGYNHRVIDKLIIIIRFIL